MWTDDSKNLDDLMKSIENGEVQLPDFQRDWRWNDTRIRKLITSLIKQYPIGALMFLQYGGDGARFKYRPIEGSPSKGIVPESLILDGQQRLTSIYAALFNKNPVDTKSDKGDSIKRYYYLDIDCALDPSKDPYDAVISIPETKKIVSDIGRTVELDLTTRELEIEKRMFPLNICFDELEKNNWLGGYLNRYGMDSLAEIQGFYNKIIISNITKRVIPIIYLEKNTPKEAVCQVFENVNTGGVSLTVFELVTAIFASDDFALREDWEERSRRWDEWSKRNVSGDVLNAVTSTDFLTACTLLISKKKGGTVSCKKKDVLQLKLEDYLKYKDELTAGFEEARDLLEEQCIFSARDLPYTTQLIPLAVLCTLLKPNKVKSPGVRDKLKQWYWCGVFGELYGGANETRYVNDVVGVMEWIEKQENKPKTVQESYFNPTRLLTMQSRQSAAYKGIMALILKNHCKDLVSGREMDLACYKAENIDIHHVFPKSYCEKMNFKKEKWNSVVNKTPISYSTNREIGGVSPSAYLTKRIEERYKANREKINDYLKSHWLDVEACRTDNFDKFIVERAKCLLNAIEKATGKPVTERDSDEVMRAFGETLADSQ